MSVVKIIRFAILAMCLGLHASVSAEITLGNVIQNPATLAARDLDELIGMVGDGINPSQISKHGGDFDKYFSLAEDGRAGKVFEAVVADKSNLKLPTGKALLVAAAEGDKQGAADMMLATKTEAGYVVDELYQLKLGYQATVAALKDSKYAGMKIITTQEAYDRIAEDVRRESIKKASLGKELSPDIARLKDALESGRIPKELPGGVPLPTREEVKAISKVYYSGLWEKLCEGLRGSAATTAAPLTDVAMDAEIMAASIGSELLATGELGAMSEAEAALSNSRRLMQLSARLWLELGRGALALDSAYTSWLIATDYDQWQDGSVPTEEFLALSSLRTIKICLEIAAVVDPELFSKAAFTVALIVVSGLDYAYERVCLARREDVRAALMLLETEERYQMTRQIVLGN